MKNKINEILQNKIKKKDKIISKVIKIKEKLKKQIYKFNQNIKLYHSNELKSSIQKKNKSKYLLTKLNMLL